MGKPSAVVSMESHDVLLRACHALMLLIRDDYPDHYSLAEIAAEWGPDVGLSESDIDAFSCVASLITE